MYLLAKNMEKKRKNKNKKRSNFWSYIYFSPYIILMGISYLIGFILLMFRASYRRLIRIDENYYHTFKSDEEHLRNILKSMFDD